MASCEMGSPIIETDIMISFGVLKGGGGGCVPPEICCCTQAIFSTVFTTLFQLNPNKLYLTDKLINCKLQKCKF